MATFEHKAGTGSLFKNEPKQKENSPDYTGSIKDNSGKVWRLAAWVKEGAKGKFMSLSLSEPQQTPKTAGTDDLPF